MSDGCYVKHMCLNRPRKNGKYCMPLQNVKLMFKNLAFCTHLLNKNLICKKLAFCTLSRKKKFDLSISADLGEQIKTRGRDKSEIINVCRVPDTVFD